MKKIRQWIQDRQDKRFAKRYMRYIERCNTITTPSGEVFTELPLMRTSPMTDMAFLEQLEQVLQYHKIKASPVFDGYLITTGFVSACHKELTNKPLDRIRYDIEHPNPTGFEVERSPDGFITAGGLSKPEG